MWRVRRAHQGAKQGENSWCTSNCLAEAFLRFSEYKYEHNEAYRKKIDELDARQKAREDERINKLKSELREFIGQDLEKEKQLNPAVK